MAHHQDFMTNADHHDQVAWFMQNIMARACIYHENGIMAHALLLDARRAWSMKMGSFHIKQLGFLGI